MLSIITAIAGLAGSLGKAWIEKKKVKAEGKIKIEAAKIEARVKRVDQKFELDKAGANDMRHSWKDEYLTIMMSIPVIMCFIPGLDDVALRGFTTLKQTPEWYRWAFLGIVVATFGLRTWFNKFNK